MIKLLLIIGTGGFLGTVSRFLASRYFQNLLLSSFPFGTFIVNTETNETIENPDRKICNFTSSSLHLTL